MTAVDTRARNIELEEALEQSANQIKKLHRRERAFLSQKEYRAATEVANARIMERDRYGALLVEMRKEMLRG